MLTDCSSPAWVSVAPSVGASVATVGAVPCPGSSLIARVVAVVAAAPASAASAADEDGASVAEVAGSEDGVWVGGAVVGVSGANGFTEAPVVACGSGTCVTLPGAGGCGLVATGVFSSRIG